MIMFFSHPSKIDSFCRRARLCLLMLPIACSLSLTACTHQQANPKIRYDRWSATWGYQKTAWYQPVSQWLDQPRTPLNRHYYKHTNAFKRWNEARLAIIKACSTTTLPDWLESMLTLPLIEQRASLNTYALLHANNTIELTGDTDSITTERPKVIGMADLNINNDCAAITLLIALKRYQHPFMLDLSHNIISNRGVAYMKQILIGHAQPSKDHKIELNLRHNPSIGPLGTHYLLSSLKTTPNVKVYLDSNHPDQQKLAFARALALEASQGKSSSDQTILFSNESFARGTRGLEQLVTLLANKPMLQELHLIHQYTPGRLDWSAAIAIAEIIKPYQQLKSLSVYNQPIGDKGVVAILNVLKNDHPHIRLLNFGATNISDATLKHLSATFNRPSMIIMIADNPNISIEAIRQLSVKHPQWVILR